MERNNLALATAALQRAVDLSGGQNALARMIGVGQGHVWYWLRRSKRIPAERAAQVERATDGAVTKEELRPDLFGADQYNSSASPKLLP